MGDRGRGGTGAGKGKKEEVESGERNRSGRRNCSIVKEKVEMNNGARDLCKKKLK